jgi:hypothetical protein
MDKAQIMVDGSLIDVFGKTWAECVVDFNRDLDDGIG